jgi:hypothetical protein
MTTLRNYAWCTKGPIVIDVPPRAPAMQLRSDLELELELEANARDIWTSYDQGGS